MNQTPSPGNGYKIAAILLLVYGAFAFFAVALPAFSTAVSTGIVSVLFSFGCIIGGIVCWRKYKKLLSEYVRRPPVDPNFPVSPPASEAPPATPKVKAEPDLPSMQTPHAPVEPKDIAQPSALEKLANKNAAAPTTKNFHVTGISHYIDALLSLSYENADYALSKRELIDADLIDERVYELLFDPIKVELVPEPNNPVDKNAIQVFVDGALVGYIKKGSCSQVKNLLASDKLLGVTCDISGGKYKIVYEELDEDTGKETYTLEHEEAPYGITIHITLKVDYSSRS